MSNPLTPKQQRIIDYIRAEQAKDPNRIFYLDEQFPSLMDDHHDDFVELERSGYIQGCNDLPGGGGGAGFQKVPHIGYTITIK